MKNPTATAVRGSQFEVSVPTPFLSEGTFLIQGIQGIQAIPPKFFLRRLGVLTSEQLQRIEQVLLRWQGIRK